MAIEAADAPGPVAGSGAIDVELLECRRGVEVVDMKIDCLGDLKVRFLVFGDLEGLIGLSGITDELCQ